MEEIRAFLEANKIFSANEFAKEKVYPQVFRLQDLLSENPWVTQWLESQGDVAAPGHLQPFNIAVWMHGRWEAVGHDAALTELETAIAVPGPIIPFEVMLFDGLSFASSDEAECFKFDNDVELGALELHSDELVFPALDEFPLKCILMDKRQQSDTFGERCLDICRLLTLVRPKGQAVQPKLFTKAWRKNAPFPQGRDMGFPRRPKMRLQAPVIAWELESTNALLGDFMRLAPQNQERVRTVLDHYSFVGSNVTLVEAAIHMRICIEAILMQSDKGDNTHKVSRRGAHMLGGDLNQRLEHCNLLIQAYRAGSSAVHSAEVNRKELKDWDQIQDVLRKLVRCWFDAGAPFLTAEQWKHVELGAEFPPDA